MFNKVTKTFQYGQHTVVLETGEIARQASGAVLVSIEDTVVLATVVAAKKAKPGQTFFPLTVDYIEKTYAAGRIPGGFFKREGKPSEKETLTSRLIDRPLRPLFPEDFYNEVQVVLHTISVNPEIDPDIPAMIGASAALAISGIPFNGPIGAARVGYVDGQYVINPTASVLKQSKLDLVVAGTETAVLMVESGADQLSEEVMLGGVVFGHEQMQAVINAIHDLVREAGKPEWDWTPPAKDEGLIAAVKAAAQDGLNAAYQIREKQERTAKLREVHADVKTRLQARAAELGEAEPDSVTVDNILFDLESRIVRSQILNGEPRIDGRDTRTVRPISVRLGVLPRAHGSALFTRGETQALVVTTLGTRQDEQIIDALMGEYRDRFMLHYNMPPFATGEAGRIGEDAQHLGEGERDQREIGAAQPGPEAQEADDPADECPERDRDRHRRPGIHTVAGLEDRRGIGAGAEECRMAEGGLPGDAAEQVPALRRQRDDQYENDEVQHRIGGDDERHRRQHRQHEENRKVAAPGHARAPNRPVGRKSRTRMKIRKMPIWPRLSPK